MVTISEQQRGQLTQLLGLRDHIVVTQIKQYNHVYRLDSGSDTFYLKTYTKDWYGNDVAATSGCVEHEAGAWSILAAHGLAATEVVLAGRDCENPLGRPFLITRQLRGASLTEQIRGSSEAAAMLRAIGAYLSRVHAITFQFPGYLSHAGPATDLDQHAWQHRCWSAGQRQRDAQAMLASEKHHLSAGLVRALESEFATIEQRMASAYLPPRYTLGDCHASHFFVFNDADGWQVSGFVDAEVASAGDCGEDLIKFAIEMCGIGIYTRWWEPFFEGYRAAPDFELFRLRLLGAAGPELLGWAGTREQILTHILNAQSWEALFLTQTG